MNNNILAGLFVVLLFLSALTASLFCFRYLSSMRKLSHLQAQFVAIQNRRTQIQALANDAIEYSKRNPAIDPLLQELSIKPKAVLINNMPSGSVSTGAPPKRSVK